MAMGGILNQTTPALPLSNGVYDAGNKRIVNVADPVNDGDAVNKGWVEQNKINAEWFKKQLLVNYTFTSSQISTTFNMPTLNGFNGFFFDMYADNLETDNAASIALQTDNGGDDVSFFGFTTNNYPTTFQRYFIVYPGSILFGNIYDNNEAIFYMGSQSYRMIFSHSETRTTSCRMFVIMGNNSITSGSVTISLYYF